MAGNGYFDIASNTYVPNSTETWASYSLWSAFTEWSGTPNLPLTFTTDVIDYGASTVLNYLCTVEANYPAYITVKYGDTVDSAGGTIDSPSTINVSPSQSLSAVKGRYFQFTLSIDRDSASQEVPFIASINSSLTQELLSRTLTNLDTSTLPQGGTGYGEDAFRELTGIDGISGITSIVTQVQRVAGKYVEGATDTDYYVGPQDSTYDLYVEEKTFTQANVYVDKEPTPPRLYIYTGTGEKTDVVIDAIVQGLPALSSDANGNIVQG